MAIRIKPPVKFRIDQPMKEGIFLAVFIFSCFFFTYAEEDYSASYSEVAASGSAIESTYADTAAYLESQYANESVNPSAWAVEASSSGDGGNDYGASYSEIISSNATINAMYSDIVARHEAQFANESILPAYWGAGSVDDQSEYDHYIDLTPRSNVDLRNVAIPPVLRKSESSEGEEKPFTEKDQDTKKASEEDNK
ncbi:MAG: hypothetical protein NTZ63_03810 [Candidatus Omnitrophica bacterium]|nr:hypothetical protein [Candidatus Omnitrophota bacterium]